MIKAVCIACIVGVYACGIPFQAYSDDQKEKAQGLDMVSDTVATAFNKANALLAGDLDITMSPDKTDTEEEFTTNALGQKVPKNSAIKSPGSLHNDQPL